MEEAPWKAIEQRKRGKKEKTKRKIKKNMYCAWFWINVFSVAFRKCIETPVDLNGNDNFLVFILRQLLVQPAAAAMLSLYVSSIILYSHFMRDCGCHSHPNLIISTRSTFWVVHCIVGLSWHHCCVSTNK